MSQISILIAVVGFVAASTSPEAWMSPASPFTQRPDSPEIVLQGEGSAPDKLACLEAAKELLLEERAALRLCAGATSRAPVSCFERADKTTLLEETLLVDLCTCATSTEPADCYVTTDEKLDLSEREIVRMCNAC